MHASTVTARRAALALALFTAACEGGNAPAGPVQPDPQAVASIHLAADSVELLEQGSKPLAATLRNAAGAELTGRAIAWESSDTAVAIVSEDGIIWGKRSGSALISASAGGKRASARVRILPVTVDRIQPSKAQLALTSGSSEWIAAVLLAADGRVLLDRQVQYASSATDVATVDAGKVTARKPGVAIITISSEGKSATVRVEVSAPLIAGKYSLHMWDIVGNGTRCYLNGMELTLTQAGRTMAGESAVSEDGMSSGCAILGGGVPPFTTPEAPVGLVAGDVDGVNVHLMLETGWWLDGTLRANGSIDGTLRYEEVVNGQVRHRTGSFQLLKRVQ